MEALRSTLSGLWLRIKPYFLYILYGTAIFAGLLIFLFVKPENGTPPETTAPPSSAVPEESIPVYTDTSWLQDPQEFPSYEEFLSSGTVYSHADADTQSWAVNRGGKLKKYALKQDTNFGLKIMLSRKQVWVVPDSREYGSDTYAIVTTNGRVGCLKSQTQVLAIDLVSGEVTVVAEGDQVLKVQMCEGNLIFAAVRTGSTISAYRLYLPTGKLDCLFEQLAGEIPALWAHYYSRAAVNLLSWRTPLWASPGYEDYAASASVYALQDLPDYPQDRWNINLGTADQPKNRTAFLTWSAKKELEVSVYYEESITPSKNSVLWTVPNSVRYSDWDIFGSNGRIAVLSSNTQVVALDLLTGEDTAIIQGDSLLRLDMPTRDVIFAACRTGNSVTIRRLYLPTMTLDTLRENIDYSTWEIDYSELAVNLLCWRTDPEYPSYEAFFSQDRDYFTNHSQIQWMVIQADTASLYKLEKHFERLYVTGDDILLHEVPNSAGLLQHTILGVNGRYAYLHDDRQILQLDLLTGHQTLLYESPSILSASLLGRDVLYFAARTGETYSIFRLYLPEQRLDVLYDAIPGDIPTSWFQFLPPTSTLGDIRWITLNPAHHDLLKQELSNPNSPYRHGNDAIDYRSLWDHPEYITNPDYEDRLLLWLCLDIQNDTGVRVFKQSILNTGIMGYSEKFGIIDNCWFGTGHDHDHYA